MRTLVLFLFAVILCSAAPAALVPARIVSTAPGFTETVFALDAGDRVVAVSTYCHYPAQVNKLQRVGDYLKPNVEAIARLKPDLVLVHAEQKQIVQQLEALGIPVLALRNSSMEEVFVSIRQIAAALGIVPRGLQLDQSIRRRLSDLERVAKSKPSRSLLFIVGRTPGTLEGMIAVGRGSFLNELIRIAGGRNVFSDSPVTYPSISMESVVRLAPDVVVDMGDMSETTGVTEAHKRAVTQLWKSQPGVRANIHAVASDIFVVPGPRIAEAAEAFAKMLQGN